MEEQSDPLTIVPDWGKGIAMCTETMTSLKTQAVDLLIELNRLEGEQLLRVREGISLHARICRAKTETPDNEVEIARLQRDEAQNQLDKADLDLEIAKVRASLRTAAEQLELLQRPPATTLFEAVRSRFMGGVDGVDIVMGFGSPLGDIFDLFTEFVDLADAPYSTGPARFGTAPWGSPV